MLESQEQFRIRCFDFGAVGVGEVKSSFERVHIPGQRIETAVGRLLWDKRRVGIQLTGSNDGGLFRVAAAAGIAIEAIVTVGVETYERAVSRFTLVSLVDREAVLSNLEEKIRQMRLPFVEQHIDFLAR